MPIAAACVIARARLSGAKPSTRARRADTGSAPAASVAHAVSARSSNPLQRTSALEEK